MENLWNWMNKRLNMKAGSCSNSISYGVFTIVPIILFSIILILKLRTNYDVTVRHIEESLKDCKGSKTLDAQRLNSSLRDIKKSNMRLDSCLDHLKRFNRSWIKMNSALEKSLSQGQKTKSLLRKLHSLSNRLKNVSAERDEYMKKVEDLSAEINRLNSNTSRLQGEKEGLEKVFEVLKDTHGSAHIERGGNDIRVDEVEEIVESKIEEIVNGTKKETSTTRNMDVQSKKLNKITF